MKCESVKIVLKDDAVPYNLTTPRRISHPLAPKVEEEIQRMLKEGVIVPVDKETGVHCLRLYSNQMGKCVRLWITRNSTKLSRDRDS